MSGVPGTSTLNIQIKYFFPFDGISKFYHDQFYYYLSLFYNKNSYVWKRENVKAATLLAKKFCGENIKNAKTNFSFLAEENGETKLDADDYLDKELNKMPKYRLLTSHLHSSETFHFPSKF